MRKRAGTFGEVRRGAGDPVDEVGPGVLETLRRHPALVHQVVDQGGVELGQQRMGEHVAVGVRDRLAQQQRDVVVPHPVGRDGEAAARVRFGRELELQVLHGAAQGGTAEGAQPFGRGAPGPSGGGR